MWKEQCISKGQGISKKQDISTSSKQGIGAIIEQGISKEQGKFNISKQGIGTSIEQV